MGFYLDNTKYHRIREMWSSVIYPFPSFPLRFWISFRLGLYISNDNIKRDDRINCFQHNHIYPL